MRFVLWRADLRYTYVLGFLGACLLVASLIISGIEGWIGIALIACLSFAAAVNLWLLISRPTSDTKDDYGIVTERRDFLFILAVMTLRTVALLGALNMVAQIFIYDFSLSMIFLKVGASVMMIVFFLATPALVSALFGEDPPSP